MKLSVCSPVLNEMLFIRLWLEHTLSFADEVCVIDGGSLDGTQEVLRDYRSKYPSKIKLHFMQQQGEPYSNDWKENLVRTMLIDEMATGDFILMLDVDEYISTDPNVAVARDDKFTGFEFIPFWKNLNTVRLNTPLDPHWFPNHIYRLFPRGKAGYSSDQHHCVLSSKLPLYEAPESRIFHLHYALDTFNGKLKRNDNRRNEVGINSDGTYDWDYGNKHPEIFGAEWAVKTKPFYTNDLPLLLRGLVR